MSADLPALPPDVMRATQRDTEPMAGSKSAHQQALVGMCEQTSADHPPPGEGVVATTRLTPRAGSVKRNF